MRTEISAERVKGDFIEKVEELSGQSIWACYQCGCCSSGCPVAEEMDLLPNQVIRYVQLGLEEELLVSKTIWLCASCFQCFSRCPRGIDISKIMDALRQMAMEGGVDRFGPVEIPSQELAHAPQQVLVTVVRKLGA
jgi:heterodisulfide reductase subunit C